MLADPDPLPIWLDFVTYVQPNTGSGSPPPSLLVIRSSSGLLGLTSLLLLPCSFLLFSQPSLIPLTAWKSLSLLFHFLETGCIGPCSISQLSILSIHIPHNAIVGLVTLTYQGRGIRNRPTRVGILARSQVPLLSLEATYCFNNTRIASRLIRRYQEEPNPSSWCTGMHIIISTGPRSS